MKIKILTICILKWRRSQNKIKGNLRGFLEKKLNFRIIIISMREGEYEKLVNNCLFRNEEHEIHLREVNKLALNSFDENRKCIQDIEINCMGYTVSTL